MPQDSTPTFVRSEMNNRSVLVSNEFVQVVGFCAPDALVVELIVDVLQQ